MAVRTEDAVLFGHTAANIQDILAGNMQVFSEAKDNPQNFRGYDNTE